MTAGLARFAALALALLARLGFPLCPLTAGTALPVVVPRCAPGGAYLPVRLLGLPGDWTPMTGGMP